MLLGQRRLIAGELARGAQVVDPLSLPLSKPYFLAPQRSRSQSGSEALIQWLTQLAS